MGKNIQVVWLVCALFCLLLLSGDIVASEGTNMNAVRFSHRLHKEDAELDCAYCHKNVEKSGSGTDDLMPRKDSCSECHDVEDENTCGQCHLTKEAKGPAKILSYNPLFPHSKHSGEGFDCELCHRGISLSKKESETYLPKMKLCMDCHREKGISDGCATCHRADENLIPSDHRRGYTHLHGRKAAMDSERCTLCHRDTDFCQKCHEGDNITGEKKPHPSGYLHRHGIDARRSDSTCLACHHGRTMCNDCHRAMRVKPSTHRAGWYLVGKGGRHASAGRRNLEICISCHSGAKSDPLCTRCHK
jgi:hypothetical protein